MLLKPSKDYFAWLESLLGLAWLDLLEICLQIL
jgi:hypothetical protein